MFSKPKKAIGLDIGTYSVKAVQMSRSGGRLYIDEVGFAKLDRMAVNEDPVGAHAAAVREALMTMSTKQALLVGALPGQTAVIRYPRLANVGQEMMDLAIQKEAGQSIPYDLNEVYLDWTLLSESVEGEQTQSKLLLVAAKHEVIDARVQIYAAAEIECGIMGVDSLALSDAAEACMYLNDGETVALINIGLSSSSIHFVKDGISNFIRDVNWGGRELIQAVGKERRVDFDAAEHMLSNIGNEAEVPDATQEVEAQAAAPPLPPRLDDPFGEADTPSQSGSLLDPLDDEFGSGASAAQGGGGYGGGGEGSLAEALHAPLARMVAEVRRSFDYYEHQLYERPVDRIILSGGMANLELLRTTLMDELGLENVEVADPTRSALLLGDEAGMLFLREQPSSYMVAIGLAARGMADL